MTMANVNNNDAWISRNILAAKWIKIDNQFQERLIDFLPILPVRLYSTFLNLPMNIYTILYVETKKIYLLLFSLEFDRCMGQCTHCIVIVNEWVIIY